MHTQTKHFLPKSKKKNNIKSKHFTFYLNQPHQLQLLFCSSHSVRNKTLTSHFLLLFKPNSGYLPEFQLNWLLGGNSEQCVK